MIPAVALRRGISIRNTKCIHVRAVPPKDPASTFRLGVVLRADKMPFQRLIGWIMSDSPKQNQEVAKRKRSQLEGVPNIPPANFGR